MGNSRNPCACLCNLHRHACGLDGPPTGAQKRRFSIQHGRRGEAGNYARTTGAGSLFRANAGAPLIMGRVPLHTMALIMDTTAVIGLFEHIGRPSLICDLRTICGDVIVPDIVREEVEVKSRVLDEYILNGKIKTTNAAAHKDLHTLGGKYKTLGRGETSVLLTWEYLQRRGMDALCVLDDGRARKMAKKNAVSFTGTVGLLKMLESRDLLSPRERHEITKNLVDMGAYLPASDGAACGNLRDLE